ncbi:Solute-binding protein Bpro_3107 [Rhodovastum atsumiense]|uniref:TRAP transporter substrate-binding protein n=1 Tax=Rhodovastum atsumiense TaxID=504468 RepID=A0A5M6IJ37_9PROT|nr:TRAP transporter substrate-binding protein [Rhodovastum atsumiense]KAA5608142.1 TRAP transporter substrate-binding protein [Rhodovastum atsumiense]CAH2599365.1 Solute-binding protein Bpro_3107 [Rhodovastum atsumiense]
MTAVAGAFALGASQLQAREFRSADVQPADYPTVKAVQFMSDQLKKATDGKYSIKVFANSQLGSEKDTIEQVKLGAIDFLRVNSGTINTICPAMMLPVLPFVFRDTAHMHAVLDGPIGDELLADCTSHGMVGLAFYDSGSRSFYTKVPIRSMADLKGQKIRVQQSDVWVSMMRMLGANATPMPTGEVYTGLKTGLIDGAENNWPTYQSSHQYEVAKYYTLTEHSMAPEVLLMSQRLYKSFTPAEQQAVRQAAKDSVPYMRKLWQEMETSSREIVEKSGVQVATIDKAPFQAAMKPVYDQFVTDPKLKALLVRIQETK